AGRVPRFHQAGDRALPRHHREGENPVAVRRRPPARQARTATKRVSGATWNIQAAATPNRSFDRKLTAYGTTSTNCGLISGRTTKKFTAHTMASAAPTAPYSPIPRREPATGRNASA